MKLICYANPEDDAGIKIQDAIHRLNCRSDAEVHRSVESLSCRLRQPGNGATIAILSTSSKADLGNILSLYDLLCDLRIILVLPDRDKDTVAKGLRLRPRFLTFADSDFNEVYAVLGKMLRTYRSESARRQA
jgi:hypothetical protein